MLDAYDAELRRLVADTPELTAPATLERLRPFGYTGGITILRDRLREPRPRPARPAFLTSTSRETGLGSFFGADRPGAAVSGPLRRHGSPSNGA